MSLPRRIALVLLLAVSAGAQAQQVFRIVGPDGKVTFSDRPASSDADTAASAAPAVVDSQSNGPGINTALLPYDLRQVAQRYPVTLYSGQGCAPCSEARSMLVGRGIPFIEKTVTTAADADAFQRISGGSTLPFATIGSQSLHGYSSGDWSQYLTLAGYPQQSQLPGNYRPPAPAPLVAVTRPRPAAAPAQAPQRQAPALPPANPAGIQF